MAEIAYNTPMKTPTEPTTTTSLPSDDEIESAANRYAESENDCYTNDYNGYKKGSTDMRSIAYPIIDQLQKENEELKELLIEVRNIYLFKVDKDLQTSLTDIIKFWDKANDKLK